MRNIQFQSVGKVSNDKIDQSFFKLKNLSLIDFADELYSSFNSMAQYGQYKHIIAVTKRGRVFWRDDPERLVILIEALIHTVSMASDDQYEFIEYCLGQVKKIYDKENLDFGFTSNLEIDRLKLTVDEQTHQLKKDEKEEVLKNYLSDLDLVSSKDYIYIYRGFHTYDESKIRMSNDKDSKKYFKQKEGSGVSYSLDKRLAYIFSTNIYSIVNFHNASRALSLESNLEYKKTKKFKNLPFGRATIARYLVRKKDLIFISNMMNEREVTVHPDDALLVDYKFISDKEYESEAFNSLKLYEMNSGNKTYSDGVRMIKESEDFKNHWINTKWKENSPIPPRIKKILEK